MTQFKCKECGEVFPSERSLHCHLKKHKISIAEYYYKYWPRHDLWTAKPIKFKNVEQYFSEDFNSSVNFRNYCQKANKFQVKTLLEDKMRKIISKKNLKKCMGQVQLLSYGWPDIKAIKDLYDGSYTYFCKAVGTEPQFYKKMPNSFFEDLDDKDIEIWVDTREQKPLSFSVPSKVIKLDFGDYTIGGELFSNTYVDRKSRNDFIGTMSKGLDRFKQEMERCVSLGGYMFIVVDCSMESIKKQISFAGRYKTNIDHIYHNMREILNDFEGSCQFVFSGGRQESEYLIPKILYCGEEIWRTDIQYQIDHEL